MFDLYQFAIRDYWTAIGVGRISEATVSVKVWKSLSRHERGAAGFAANCLLRGVHLVENDPSGPLSSRDVRGEADRDRRGVRGTSLALAFGLGLFIVTLVVMFALEFQFFLAFMRACMRSLTVFQHLDRR